MTLGKNSIIPRTKGGVTEWQKLYLFEPFDREWNSIPTYYGSKIQPPTSIKGDNKRVPPPFLLWPWKM